MSISANVSVGLETVFDSIAIETLNAKAPLLERLDNKYVVGPQTVAAAFRCLARHFDVLEIGTRRCFAYQNCYFDGPELAAYFHHHQGRRERCKVRKRHYIGTGLCFLEVKLKDKRCVTVKRRFPCAPETFGEIDASGYQQVQSSYRDMYRREFGDNLRPTLETRYERMTLVAKTGGERITFDSFIGFSSGARSVELGSSAFIIETKSRNGNGLGDKVLRSLHQHPVKHCSKYCLGMALIMPSLRQNNFRPAIRRLRALNADF